MSRLGIFIIITVTCLWFANPSFGETSGNALGFGFSGGLVSGTGFSIRMLPEQGLGYHVGAFYIKTKRKYLHIGVEPLYVIHRSYNTAIYALGGVGYLHFDGRQKWAWGAGFGYAWHASNDFWMSADLLLTAYNNQVLPYPQLAFHYMVW